MSLERIRIHNMKIIDRLLITIALVSCIASSTLAIRTSIIMHKRTNELICELRAIKQTVALTGIVQIMPEPYKTLNTGKLKLKIQKGN